VPYRIHFAEAVQSHLDVLTAAQKRTVFRGVEQQLAREPTVETRNRKLMRPNPLAAWELRLGDLRVYYRVIETPESVVQIAAVGLKKRNEVWIGGKRVSL
jgi:hypothetical protein